MGKDLAAYNTKLVGWVERSETHHLTPFGKHRWVSRVAQPTLRADEAIVWFEKGRGSMPAVPVLHSRLAAAYALRGESERAAAELAEARRLNGDLYSSIAQVKAGGSRVVRRSAPCTKPAISLAYARRECRRSEADRSSGIRSPQSHCKLTNWRR
jgi:hypothetical protein